MLQIVSLWDFFKTHKEILVSSICLVTRLEDLFLLWGNLMGRAAVEPFKALAPLGVPSWRANCTHGGELGLFCRVLHPMPTGVDMPKGALVSPAAFFFFFSHLIHSNLQLCESSMVVSCV